MARCKLAVEQRMVPVGGNAHHGTTKTVIVAAGRVLDANSGQCYGELHGAHRLHEGRLLPAIYVQDVQHVIGV